MIDENLRHPFLKHYYNVGIGKTGREPEDRQASTSSALRVGSRRTMRRRFRDRLARFPDIARLFDLPPRHPDRMIAAQLVLYIGLAIVIGVALWRRLVAP